ncbi:rotamase, partial [[Eubacterium] siraeum]|nr:rotamase [[Eubacterium] siraeum]
FEKKAQTAIGISTDDTSGTEDSANDEKILEKEKDLFNEYIAGFGLTEDTFLMWQTNTAIQKKVNNYVLKDVAVSDSEVDYYITKLKAEAKQAYVK